MQPESDAASQVPATDSEQDAWQRLVMFVEQHVVNSVPHDPGPTVVQPAANAQTPVLAAPISTQSPMCARDRLRPAPPDSFDGEREKGRAFINSCDLYMSLVPDAFPDEQMRINWALSYMKGGRTARFAAHALRHPLSHSGAPHFRSYAEFCAQFIVEFCPQDEKQKAATTLETSAYHQGSRSVDKYIDEFMDLVKEAQFPDGA
ncbi:hypothetical protein LshimejAT787_4500010, partial [Lyophyllum shimeji]